MEDCSMAASAFCSKLRGLCTHVASITSTLRSSLDKPPPSFHQGSDTSLLTTIDERAYLSSKEVEALNAMSVGTVSFEELLGHCFELYKQNEGFMVTLEERLRQYGYNADASVIQNSEEPFNSKTTSNVEEIEAFVNGHNFDGASNKGGEEFLSLSMPSLLSSSGLPSTQSSTNQTRREPAQDDALFSDLLSLEDLGLSAAGLECLAGEASPLPLEELSSFTTQEATPSPKIDSSLQYQDDILAKEVSEACDTQSMVCMKVLQEEEYKEAPSWLKMQVSFKDLNAFISKINNVLASKAKRQQGMPDIDLLDQDDLKGVGAGLNVKACLLLVVRLGLLTTEYRNGSAVYRIRL